MKVLVTGGAGYIGSHTTVSLIENGFDVVVVDNFSNSKEKVLERLKTITNKEIKCYKVDCCDYEELRKVFVNEQIDAVIHFAGYKAVGESVRLPLMYYQNNLDSLLTTVKLMLEFKVNNLVFSSSATVYGKPKSVPIYEDFPLSVTNPYGRTKLMIEEILADVTKANSFFKVAILRYFNPIGAHESGLLGEDPEGIPNNLMPYITQVCIGKLPKINVFGNDYDTIDGTGVRDYIHVMDLAYGHVLALNKLSSSKDNYLVYNLGTGKGTSVLELINAMQEVVNKPIPYEIVERRPGDIDCCYANCDKAFNELGFKAKYNIHDMCETSWNFQVKNPKGIL